MLDRRNHLGLFSRSVKLFRIIVVWILAIAWLPATSHCLLGSAGWLPELCCEEETSHDTNEGDHDEHNEFDVCTAIESGDYNFNKPTDFDFNFDAALAWEHVYQLALFALAERGFSLRSRAPPDLAKRWAFILRVAVPGRAPSILA